MQAHIRSITRNIIALLTVIFFIPNFVLAEDLATEITSGKIAILNSDTDEYDFGYLTIDFTPVGQASQFQDYVYDIDTQAFVEIDVNDDGDYLLTADGWMPVAEDFAITAFSGNTATLTSSIGESILITGEPLDTSSLTPKELIEQFAQSINDEYDRQGALNWLAYLDPSFSFTAEAAIFQFNVTQLQDTYFLWLPQGCDGLISDDCWYTQIENNGQPQGAMTALDDMFTETEWNNEDINQLRAVNIAWGNSGVLKAEFVEANGSSGLVNFYYQDYTRNLVRKIAYGQWQRVQKMGSELVLLELSDELVNAVQSRVDLEDRQLFFTVFGGYVRNGGYYLAGQVDSEDNELLMNMAALEQLTSNFEVVDTDLDGIIDHLDEDDDNDGIDDEYDAFPLLASEWFDTDGDGIGNNQDNDDDGDGVADGQDLAPLNDQVSVALDFTAADMSAEYIQLSNGAITNPNIPLNSAENGAVFQFLSDGTFIESFADDYVENTWSIENNVLTIHEFDRFTEFVLVQLLVDEGLISQEVADTFVNTYGNIQIEVTVDEIEARLQLLENTDSVDRLWVRAVTQFQIVNDDFREILLGDVEAEPIEVLSEGEEVMVTQTDSLIAIDFVPDDLLQPWALPVFRDLQQELDSFEGIAVDLITFNSNNTASGALFEEEYTWEIDDGTLILTQSNGAVITAQLFEQFDPGVGVHTTYTDPDQLNTYSKYSFVMDLTADVSITPLLNNFLMSGSVLTDPYAYDNDNQILLERYFGFAFFEDGSGIRVTNGYFNLADDWGFGGSWNEVLWEIKQNGELHADYNFSVNNGNFGCDPQTDESCNMFLSRRLIPLNVTDNRLYAIEWRVRNDNAFSPNSEPSLRVDIAPRVQFFEIFELDLDGDNVNDAQDDFPRDNFEWLDSDNDGIGNNLDKDDDNDGVDDLLDAFPLDPNESVDTDSDGIGNNADEDDDGDGIPDIVDENPLIFDAADPTLFSGQLHVLPDINDDGIAELGIMRIDTAELKVSLEILNGQDKASLSEIVWSDNYVDTTVTLHIIPDMNNNGADEVGVFGIQDKANNEGKPQMFVRDLQTGNRVSVYNWPANWTAVSALVLDDISGDGIAEIAIQGRFKEGSRPQLVVRNGENGSSQGTFSYPNLFNSPMFYQHSDVDGDGFAEISTFGRITRNNKIQVKITNGVDTGDRMKAYNFPDKWANISWHRLDDSNGDGEDDWGLFGTSKVDGRPQLIVKGGTDPRGALRIHAWPSVMEDAQFYVIPDMTNDGVNEVAAAGRRSNNGRYQFQIQDGTDRNVVVANHNLNLSLTEVSYHVLPDLSGDEQVEIGFMGINPEGEYELIILHGDTLNGEYARHNLGNDWQSAPAISSLGDTDNDGMPDLMVYGQNAVAEQLVIMSL